MIPIYRGADWDAPELKPLALSHRAPKWRRQDLNLALAFRCHPGPGEGGSQLGPEDQEGFTGDP